jgi:ketosteroid isomerase-like protein
MKSGLLAFTLVLAALAAVADPHADEPGNAPSLHHAAEVPNTLPRDVVGTVQAFHEALIAGNSAAVERILAPDVVVMESGNVERSLEEYAAHHLPADLEFMRTIKYTLQHQSGDAVGDLAWVASEATLAGQYQGKPVNLVSMESLVLRKEQTAWRIVHIHWSSREQSEGH